MDKALKVLIVDDQKVSRMILSDLFDNKYEIIEADNANDGLLYLRENTDDIVFILFDYTMPGVDSNGFLKEIRSLDKNKKIPVVIATDRNYYESFDECYRLGIDDRITKPFDKQTIKRRIENIMMLYEYKNGRLK